MELGICGSCFPTSVDTSSKTADETDPRAVHIINLNTVRS